VQNEKPTLSVSFGDSCVTVRRRRASTTLVAKILGDEEDEDGTRRITLDRLIHDEDDWCEGFGLEGCVVSVLVRQATCRDRARD